MKLPLQTNRFYIDSAIVHYDSMPDDGTHYVYDEGIDAYRPTAESPSTKATGYVVFAGVAVNDDILDINGRTYELDVDGTPVGTSDVTIDLSGVAASADAHITAIAAAINADASASVSAVADTANDILWLHAATVGTAGNAITIDASAVTNGTASGATMTMGTTYTSPKFIAIRKTIVAQEATDGKIRLLTPLTTISNVQIQLSDAGVIKTPDATVTVTEAAGASTILIAEGSAPAWAANDVLNILIIGV